MAKWKQDHENIFLQGGREMLFGVLCKELLFEKEGTETLSFWNIIRNVKIVVIEKKSWADLGFDFHTTFLKIFSSCKALQDIQ